MKLIFSNGHLGGNLNSFIDLGSIGKAAGNKFSDNYD